MKKEVVKIVPVSSLSNEEQNAIGKRYDVTDPSRFDLYYMSDGDELLVRSTNKNFAVNE